MKNLFSLKNMVKTVAIFAVMGLSFGLSSCNKEEDGLGAANAQDKKASLVITEKEEPKDSLWNDTIRSFRNDSIIVVINYYKNDTIIDKKNYGALVSASISREFNKLQTTEARLANLDFTFGEVSSSTNGKNQVVAKQTIQDGDGQNYTGQTTSGKIFNIYAELVSFKKTNLKNTELEPGADEAKLVNTKISWTPVVRIVNVPNLAGKEFELTTNNTEHLRYIPKNAPELVKTDTTMVRRPDVWFTNWDLIIKETWSNDSVAEKKKTVRTNASVEAITLEDKFVSSFDYSYTNDNLAWGAWKAIQSNDSSVSLEEQEGTKLGNASNGYSNDAFDTKYVAKRQRATVLFGGFKWNIPAEEVTLSTTRKVFVEQTSDLDGYSMVKFVNDEIARYNGTNDKTLTESCKLYMKVATPAELDKIEFVGTKVHTEGMAKIDGSVIPVFTDGTKGGAIEFSWERAEEWYWKNDSVIAEGVTFVNQTTGELKLKGDVKESKKTFATDNDEVTIECTQFDADFELPVTVDGVKKMTTWHATWFENFYVVYQGKKVALTKSSYNVKNQNDKLSKDEARSNATSEVWGYSVEGLFNIDEDSRSAYGYGRITKAIEEVVVTEGWDKFNFETDAKEYTDRVEYFLKWIKEYSTGKKTQTDIKVVLKRNSKGSYYDVTVENPERTIGSQSENSILTAKSEKVDDIVINYDWKTSTFELPNYFDGSIKKNDVATFVDPTNVKVTKKNSKGEDVTIELPSFEHQLTSTVSEPQVTSENDEKTVRTYERVWSWVSSQCTSAVKSIGEIITVKSTPVNPDFDIEVGSIYATVSRPSNRNASDITAYTYLLVSKDGKKCLPLGFYNGVITVDEKNGIVDYVSGMNSACYVKNENKVVATRAYSDRGLGMMIWCGADGNPVDAASHITLQGAGFNDRGNDWINHTGKYAPRATKKGNVTVVTFEGTNVSYTFKGWNVQ